MKEQFQFIDQSPEAVAVKNLTNKEEIRDFFEKFVTEMGNGTISKHEFIALKDNSDVRVQALWQISQKLDRIGTPKTRKLWAESLGEDLILSQSTKEADLEYFAQNNDVE